MRFLLKGGTVVDPASGVNGARDVLVAGGSIAKVGQNLAADGARVLEVPRGTMIVPGLIDMHVHLREPGHEHKETIATGTASAVAGGFTAVACMPNTDPINDHAGITGYILARAAEAGLARVYPIGAVSVGSKGDQLTEIGDLHRSGCVAISDDGRPVASALLMRRAMEYAGMFDMPVIDHCEDASLKADGVAHEGARSSMLGLKGLPAVAETLLVDRGILLSEVTGSRFHVAHMSVATALRSVREARSRGVRVTCEVAPHHFTLTDEALEGYDTNTKMNPPLREISDVEAMLAGLADGSIDVIATDHAPHHADEKALEFDHAPFGIVGLETAVPLCFDRLVHRGVVSLSRLVELLSVNPARILKVPGGSLAEGAVADITLLAPDLTARIDARKMVSKSKNTPFDGWELKGAAAATIVGGRIVYLNEGLDWPEAWRTDVA